MQAQSLFLLITHEGLRPNSESRLSQCPLLGGSNIHLRRRELPKQIQPHSFTIKEKHKKKNAKHSQEHSGFCPGTSYTSAGLSTALGAMPATRMVPGRSHGCPQPGSREGAGEGPARHSCAPGQAVPIFPALLACGEGGAGFGLRPEF